MGDFATLPFCKLPVDQFTKNRLPAVLKTPRTMQQQMTDENRNSPRKLVTIVDDDFPAVHDVLFHLLILVLVLYDCAV